MENNTTDYHKLPPQFLNVTILRAEDQRPLNIQYEFEEKESPVKVNQ